MSGLFAAEDPATAGCLNVRKSLGLVMSSRCLVRATAPAGGGSADIAPLALGGTSPDTRHETEFHRRRQAPLLHRAAQADPFGYVGLVQYGPGPVNREEQVRIGVEAGGIVTPVRASDHRTVPPAPIRLRQVRPSFVSGRVS